MLLTLAAAVVVLGAVIFVHELGHFIAAKLTGVGVIRFSIGFGPATPLRFRRGDTEYLLAWFPFGGYVMMASEEEVGMDESSGVRVLEGGPAGQSFPPDRRFENKPLWARLCVIGAGVAMNVLFALVIYGSLALAYGRREDPTITVAAVDSMLLPDGAQALAGQPYPLEIASINGDTVESWNDVQTAVLDPTSRALSFRFRGRAPAVAIAVPGTRSEDRVRVLRALQAARPPRLGYLAPGRPAAAAGLRPGDLVIAAAGDSVWYWDQLVRIIEQHAQQALVLDVRRGDSTLTVRVLPQAERDSDAVTGIVKTVGKIGANVQVEARHRRFGLLGAAREAARRTAGDAGLVFFVIKGLVLGQVSPRELGGPILIGQLSGQLAQIGLEPYLAFIALFSVNLAVLNLLPIPVLDGGRLVFLLAEGARGRPLSLRVRTRLSQVGVAVLVAIMALALTNDVLRLFGG